MKENCLQVVKKQEDTETPLNKIFNRDIKYLKVKDIKRALNGYK